MNFSIKFKDLLNLAIGTPDKAIVNFNALHILLHSIIEHLNLDEKTKVLPGSEKDYLSSSPFQVSVRKKSEKNEEPPLLSPTPSDKIVCTFDQRLSVVENQMAFLEALPSTEQLLEGSKAFKKPAQDMWQMLKLQKKVEGNEEGMTKAMRTLQELLTSIYNLQSDTDYFKIELEQLKEKVDKISLDEVNKQSQVLKDQQEQVKILQLDMEDVKNKLSSIPEGSDIMQWTTLHDAMYPQEDDLNKLRLSPDQGDIMRSTTSQEPIYSQADTKKTLKKTQTETSEVTPEVTSGVISEVTPGITTGVTSGVSAGVTPGVTAGVTPGVTPIVTTGVTPGVTPGVTTGVTPGITPEVTAEVTAGVTPGVTAGVTPGVIVGVTPGVTAGVTSDITAGVTPGVTAGVTTGVISDIAAGVTSGVTPGVTTGVTSGVTADIAAGVIPGVTAGVTPGVTTGVTSDITAGVTPGVTAGVTTGVISDIAAGVTSGVTPGVIPGVTAGVTTGVTSGVTTDIAAGVIPGVTAGVTPGVTTGVTSDITAGVTPGVTVGVTTGVIHEVTSDIAAGVTPGVTTDIAAGVITGAMTGITSGVTPGVTSGVTSGVTTGITPGFIPDVTPQVTSGVIPQVISGVTPKGIPEVSPEGTSEVKRKGTSKVTSEETSKTLKIPRTPRGSTKIPPLVVKTNKSKSHAKSSESDTKPSPLAEVFVAMGVTVGPETLTPKGIAIDPSILTAMGITSDPHTLAAMGISPILGAGFETTEKPSTTSASTIGPSSIGPSSTGPSSIGPSLTAPSSTEGPLGIPPDFTSNASSFLTALGVTPDKTTLDALGIDMNAETLVNLGSTVDPATLVALAILTNKDLPITLHPLVPFPTLPDVEDIITESSTLVSGSSTSSDTTTATSSSQASVKAPFQVPEKNLSSTKYTKQLVTVQPLTAEGKRRTAKRSVGSLVHLPGEYDSLKEQFTKLEEKVQQLANSIGNLQLISSFELTPQLETEMSALQDKINSLQESGQKNKTYEQHLEKVQEHCNLLEKVTETLQDKMEDIKGLKIVVKQLEMRKVDKTRMEEEMREKADKSALAFKASRADLELATVQLNDMMHDMLQKMSVSEQDWQKVLEKLFNDVDSKLGHMDLDPVKRQMEHIWKFVKKHLSEGPRFDADSAAGFKKQLFERVKCISCDRPVDMMTSPQLISIRKATLCPRARPLSANSYEYLERLKLREQQRMQQLQPMQEMTKISEQTSMPTGGQSHWYNNSSLRRVIRMPSLASLYPYGDPSVFPPAKSEVNILGVDGIMYKGRMASHGALRPIMTEKDLAALKTPRPPSSRSGYERVRSGISNAIYPAADISSTSNKPMARSATTGAPFTIKPSSASLPLNVFNSISPEEGTSM